MASSQELQWQAQKEEVQAIIDEFVNAGISLDAARKAAGWNPTFDYDDYSQLTVWPPPPVEVVPYGGISKYLRILVARSENRVNPGTLNDEVLDAGKLYAIFIPDIPELNILDITFKLNGSTVHTEFSTPWDYAGTAPGGEANRVSFVTGSYSIEAVLNASGGPFSIEAGFDVE